ncbi:DUF1549 domain-containing protein [Tautonia sociabilis]|uniref:DUF1549 domain-containing protein n=2 Tax=Tautonia sociabilis TaxID=2080755 RepID=A0A432MH41_9BACT|nr:DUF1549 domain-containing protein [Tautonia sociabilis]
MVPGALAAPIVLMLLASGLRSAPAAEAELSLHERIDRLIEAKLDAPPAAPATDGEFLRRAYLDLAGTIPSPEEARAFLDDPSPYKRDRLVDRLLELPSYARRMQYVFDATLLERRGDQHVPRADWEAFLLRCFAENVPYDEFVRRILEADGSEPPEQRAPAKFILERGADPDLLTRDIGRLFLGRDLQCAQCHDHPLIEDYKQAHYYGLRAFLDRTSLFTDPKTSRAMLAEKAEGETTFQSVFRKSVTHTTAPRILDLEPIADPELPENEAERYEVAPAKDVRSIPKYSRFDQLAPSLASDDVDAFSRTIANRLWALMMKRGLVHPLDLDHADNPPSHPELLDLLANSIRAMDYDIKAFLRELARTRAYRRSSEPPPGASEDLVEPSRFAVAGLEPLSPEQLAWSLMQALGVVDAHRQQAEADLDALEADLCDLCREDRDRIANRPWRIEQMVHDRLAGNVRGFVQIFGASEGQPDSSVESSVHQALFLSNGPLVQSWLNPSGTNLTARLAAIEDPAAVAEPLYLAVLSRRPSEEERAEVVSYLESRGADQRAAAVRELAWALVTCSEFRFDH